MLPFVLSTMISFLRFVPCFNSGILVLAESDLDSFSTVTRFNSGTPVFEDSIPKILSTVTCFNTGVLIFKDSVHNV